MESMRFPIVEIRENGSVVKIVSMWNGIDKLEKRNGLHRVYPSHFVGDFDSRLFISNFCSILAIYDLDLKLIQQCHRNIYFDWLDQLQSVPDYVFRVSTSSSGGLHVLTRLWDVPIAISNKQHRIFCQMSWKRFVDDLNLPSEIAHAVDQSVWNVNQGLCLYPFLKSTKLNGCLVFSRPIQQTTPIFRNSLTKSAKVFISETVSDLDKTTPKCSKKINVNPYMARLQRYIDKHAPDIARILTRVYTSERKGIWKFHRPTNTLWKWDKTDVLNFAKRYGKHILTKKGDRVHVPRLLVSASSNVVLADFLKLDFDELRCAVETDQKRREIFLVERLLFILSVEKAKVLRLYNNRFLNEIFDDFLCSYKPSVLFDLLRKHGDILDRFNVELSFGKRSKIARIFWR
jgi:hypothetical protein